MSFLRERSQYVRIRNRNSCCHASNAGTPQGTLPGPNDFKLLINDLSFDIDYARYVDDATIVSFSEDSNDRPLQSAADHLIDWCSLNGMTINTEKTKEMLIYFGKKFNKEPFSPTEINEEFIECVDSFKLLGVIFSSDLAWGQHVSYMLNKISKQYYLIFELSQIGIPHHEIISICCAIIRSVLEYVCAVWHSGLTTAQSLNIERVQKRCLHIIFPDLSYSDALLISGLERLTVR
jgi:hypothetical protein